MSTIELVAPTLVPLDDPTVIGQEPSRDFTLAIATAKEHPGQWLVVASTDDRSREAYTQMHRLAWRLKCRRFTTGCIESRVRTRGALRCIDIRWMPHAEPVTATPDNVVHIGRSVIRRINERTWTMTSEAAG